MEFVPRPKGMSRENFIKIQPGGSIDGLLRGKIYSFRSHFIEGGGGGDCTGVGCPICKAHPANRTSFKFRVNFISSENGKYVAKIWEAPGRAYDTLTALSTKVDFDKTPITIMKTGTGKDTNYTIIPNVHQPVTAAMEAEIVRVPLLDLGQPGDSDKGL